MLEALLLTFLVMVFLVLAAFGLAALMFSRQLNRSNRVAPDVGSTAPLTWLWSPTQPARLHRRLRAAVAPVHASVPKPAKRSRRSAEQSPPSSLDALNRTLVEQALELDRHIVIAARFPRPMRRHELVGLQAQVHEVERLSTRMINHQRHTTAPVGIPEAPVPTPPVVLADLSNQLDLLEQAHAELHQIERSSGLLDPDALMREVRPTVTPRAVAAAASAPPSGPPTGRPLPPAPPIPPTGRPGSSAPTSSPSPAPPRQ